MIFGQEKSVQRIMEDLGGTEVALKQLPMVSTTTAKPANITKEYFGMILP